MKRFLMLLLLLIVSFQIDAADTDFQKQIKKYHLPKDHSIKPVLDTIFSSTVTANGDSFDRAGFITLAITHASYLRVAVHPALPGYIFKIALEDETRQKKGRASWEWLLDRCKGAENIRKLIAKEKIVHFVVPDKWLYRLPYPSKQQVILIATDMNLTGHRDNVDAWKNKITKKHLRELHTILSHGYASAYVLANIPYTKNGTFACIDTEYVKRKVKCQQVNQFLSPEMSLYWDKLLKSGK